MDKNLNSRFIRTALISSPILALYGVAPFYIFNKVPLLFILKGSIFIVIAVLITWTINILCIRLSVTGKKRYLLSYAFIFGLHFLAILFKRIFPLYSFITDGRSPFKKDVFIVYPFVSMLAINAIILIICNSILANQKSKIAEVEIQELKVSNLEAQKQALLQQLQPHFLFNTLSVLKSLIRENPDDAENYAIKLSEFLRYSVQIHKSDLVSLEQELKFTNDYIDLQKVRFENSVIFNVSISEELYKMQLPAYALQALVENAIKHNSFTEKKPLHIRIYYAGDGAIVVCNNKLPTKVFETTGTGLKNLNQRYKIISNKEIEINDTKDEFCAKVHLLNDLSK